MYNVSPAQNNNNNNKNKDEERGVEAFDNMRHYPSIHLLVIKFRCPRARWEGSHTGQVTHLSQEVNQEVTRRLT